MGNARKLSPEQGEDLIGLLKARFQKNMGRHKNIKWEDIEVRLRKNPSKLLSLKEMELTGGEPDVVGIDKKSGEYLYFDCSKESPKGRRSVCYDRAALESRKEHQPKNSAQDMARAMGAELLTESEYRELQELEEVDLKTSSWVQTPAEIRRLGGALFCDRRYETVFLYHNGAQSYYAARGFRVKLWV